MRNYIHIIVCAILLTGCSKGLDEVPVVKPDYTNESVSLSFNTETASKADYSADLKFYWEDEDSMAVIKATAGSEQQLIKYEATEKIFSGDVEYVAGEGAFHFLYPSAGSTLTADNTGNISATVTIPENQDGKWTPILYGAVDAASLGAITDKIKLNNLTASFGVKVYNSKSEVNTNIKSITITATDSNETPLPITGKYSIIDNSLVTVDSKNSATISREAAIAYPTDNGGIQYEYRFEVAPVGEAQITITMIDVAGNTYITKTTKELSANYRSGVNVLWANGKINDSANIDFHTSYNEYLANNLTEANRTDIRNKIRLNVPTTVDGATVKLINAKTKEEIDVNKELAIGSYDCYVNIDFGNGKVYRTATKPLYITGLPYSAIPPKTNNGWTGNGDWNNDSVRLNSDDSISLTLHAPSDINISLYEELSITGKTLTLKYYLDLSGSRLASYERTYNRTTNHNETFNTALKASNPTVRCTSNANWASTSYADLKQITIKYR